MKHPVSSAIQQYLPAPSSIFLKLPVICLISSILFLSSCDREIADSPYANDSIPRIKSITEYFNGIKQRETSLTYDTASRLVKIFYNDLFVGHTYYDTLVYSGSEVIKTTFSSKNKFLEQEVYTLNSDKLAVLMTDTLGDGSTASKGIYRKAGILEQEGNIYSYDPYGYQILEISTNEYGGIHRFDKSWTAGNLITSVYQYMANDTAILNGNSNFSYFTDKRNTIGNENKGISFLGKQNKNLLQTVLDNKWLSSDTLRVTTNYRYEYDDHNRVVKQYITPLGEENDDVSYISFRYR
jgi:hypothetical protein